MVVDGFLIWSGSPSFTGILHNQHSLNAKSPCSPIGNKDRKDNFCGTTLFAGRSGRSARCQHTGCPLTLAMRQKILWFPISPCPRRPIIPIRFSLRSQLCGALCGCASGFTPASMVWDMLCSLYTKCAGLSRENFSPADKCAPLET